MAYIFHNLAIESGLGLGVTVGLEPGSLAQDL